MTVTGNCADLERDRPMKTIFQITPLPNGKTRIDYGSLWATFASLAEAQRFIARVRKAGDQTVYVR